MTDVSNGFEHRFWAKVDKSGSDGCWLWTGAINAYGYGTFAIKSTSPQKYAYAHRVSYYLASGSLPPEGMPLDHLCRVRSCVNPAHLEAVTQKENLHRGIGHGKETHCPKGHPYDLLNTRWDKKGRRICRACCRERAKGKHDAQYWREYRARRKAQGNPIKHRPAS